MFVEELISIKLWLEFADHQRTKGHRFKSAGIDYVVFIR
jgi:hypothetical protein